MLRYITDALTVETMQLPHDSYPANIDIAEVLFKTKYLDNWGSGVERMITACRDNGIEAPEYQLRPGGIAIVFKRPAASSTDTQSGTQTDTQSGTQKKVRSKTEVRWKHLVECIEKNNQMQTGKIAALFKLSVSTVKRDLKAIGYKWDGSAKSGHWVKKK